MTTNSVGGFAPQNFGYQYAGRPQANTPQNLYAFPGFAQPQQQPAPPHREAPGFFSKVGATLGGLADVPGAIGRAILNPRNIGITALSVGACLIPGVGPFVAAGLLAYGMGSAASGVISGAGNMISGWANDDLDQIRSASTELGTSAIGGAASVFGARAFVRAQLAPGASHTNLLASGRQGPVTVGKTAVTADNVTLGQSALLTQRFAWNGMVRGAGNLRNFVRDGSSWANKGQYVVESLRETGRATAANFNRFRGQAGPLRGAQPAPAQGELFPAAEVASRNPGAPGVVARGFEQGRQAFDSIRQAATPTGQGELFGRAQTYSVRPAIELAGQAAERVRAAAGRVNRQQIEDGIAQASAGVRKNVQVFNADNPGVLYGLGSTISTNG